MDANAIAAKRKTASLVFVVGLVALLLSYWSDRLLAGSTDGIRLAATCFLLLIVAICFLWSAAMFRKLNREAKGNV